MRIFSVINKVLLATVVFLSCNNQTSEQSGMQEGRASGMGDVLPYEVALIEPYETDRKAQVQAYAFVKSDSVTKQALEQTLLSIYTSLKSYNKFKNFTTPTVVGVYLYTSEEKAKHMQDAWIGMLSKKPSSEEPQISIDEMKLNALAGLNDKQESNDEKKWQHLKAYFKDRNTDLCAVYKTLYELEGESIKQADKKYPDFGAEHAKYSQSWYKTEKEKLFRKYNIHDSLSIDITVFGMSYCK